MPKSHAVVFTDGQRQELDRLVDTGRELARKVTRAQVLLKAADGETDEAIAAPLGVSVRTAERVRRRFAAEGHGAAAPAAPAGQTGAGRGGQGEADDAGLLDPADRARLLDAGPAGRPDGSAGLRPSWGAEHGGRPPQKIDLTPLRTDEWVIPPARDAAKQDQEYKRAGTAHLFVAFEPLGGWRHYELTDRRTRVDFAHFARDLLDGRYRYATTIVLVMDNLNKHGKLCDWRNTTGDARLKLKRPHPTIEVQ